MSRYFSTRSIQSEKNGTITIRYWFGTPSIFVDGYFQSGPYMQALWRTAIQHIPTNLRVENVLVLGLAGGSAITEIHMRFPKAVTTAIEWDPTMVEIARELKLFARCVEPTIIVGDAVERIPQLTTKFDLVLIDLFKGQTPEPRLSSPELIVALAQLLTPEGQLVLNAFRGTGLIDAFAHHMDHQETWRFRYNRLALYKQFV